MISVTDRSLGKQQANTARAARFAMRARSLVVQVKECLAPGPCSCIDAFPQLNGYDSGQKLATRHAHTDESKQGQDRESS
jgi:hypothetical protein